MKLSKWLRNRRERSSTDLGKADLHIHSDFSDGLSSVVEILDWVAMKTDLNVVAITDHDVMEGSWLAQTLADRYSYPFEVIPGLEVSTADGHLLVLYADHLIPAGLSIEETIALAHQQDALCILPHPYSHTGLLGTSLRYKRAPERAEALALDGVESFNGSMLISNCNRYSPRLAAQLGKPALAGSDAHVRQAVGSGATLFPGRNSAELRQAILDGSVLPAGKFWSPYAYITMGVKWSLQQGPAISLPRLPLPSRPVQGDAIID